MWRRVQLEQQRPELIAGVIRAVVVSAEVGLSEAHRQVGLRVAACELRQLGAGG
jgi:hypothetical protein